MIWWRLSPVVAAMFAFGLTARADTEERAKAKLSPELQEPVRLEAGGKPIDVGGHAGPSICDWFGKGKKDLLVGQLEGGGLWIYEDVGTKDAPRYAAGVKFKDGGKDGVVPTG